MPPSPDALRRAFADELPGFVPDEAVWEYIVQSFETGEEHASGEALAEVCEPFFISAKVARDQDDVRRACDSILRRLKAVVPLALADPGGADAEQVRGLSEWLERLKLTKYEEAALMWCEENGAVDMTEVREHWESLADELKLKKLERQRVERDAANPPPLPAPETPTAAGSPTRPTPSSASSGGKPFGDPKNPYYLLEEVGSGATATVHRCCRGEEVFAVKCIGLQRLKLQQNYSRVQEKLQRETHILFSLQHSNIVAMHDVHETEDKLYLIMEFVRGGELFEYIVRKQAMQEPEAKYVFLQLKDALQYMHGKGVVHRDLKPENILVNDADSKPGWPSVKISDFGHSKLINDGLSTAITRVGTPQYWAPEVSDGDKASKGYDWTVDLWSLGVVLYVMLEGCYPFSGIEEKIEHQIQRGHVAFQQTSRSSDQAKDLIKRLMQVKPKDRLKLEGCGKHDWLKGFATDVMDASADPKARQANEERLPLPYELPKKGQQLRRALEKFATENKVSAVLATDKRDTYINLSASCTPVARERLMDLLETHFPGEGFSTPKGSGFSMPREAMLAPCPEEGDEETPRASRNVSRGSFTAQPNKLRRHTLRVGEEGAGLELGPEMNGMRVKQIDADPGQPGMQVNDLIVKINDVALAGRSIDEVQDKFGQNFGNGAILALRRPGS